MGGIHTVCIRNSCFLLGDHSKMEKIVDENGHNAGYATFVETMAKEAEGLQRLKIFLGHEVRNRGKTKSEKLRQFRLRRVSSESAIAKLLQLWGLGKLAQSSAEVVGLRRSERDTNGGVVISVFLSLGRHCKTLFGKAEKVRKYNNESLFLRKFDMECFIYKWLLLIW